MNSYQRTGLLALMLLCQLTGETSATAPAIVFSDSTFADSDWDLTVFSYEFGGVTTATQVLTGGDTGAYREVTITLNAPTTEPSAITGFHRKIGASYDPSIQGAVASIDYSESSILLDGHGNGQTLGAAILQDGKVYRTLGLFSPDFFWVPKQLNGLQASDFAEVLTVGIVGGGKVTTVDPNSNPDFSASGSVFEVGFVRSDRATAGFPNPITLRGGIDNWQFSITPVPEPNASALALAAACLFCRRRLNKRLYCLR